MGAIAYRIPYNQKVYKYRDRFRGDRGVIEDAERRALAIVRTLIKEGRSGISYSEVHEGEVEIKGNRFRRGHIEVTADA